jgi:hypothetical protein
LPTLRKYLESNFPGLHIITKACDDDELKKIKEEQKKTKEGEGDHMVYGQGSDSSSISSSDESDLEDRAQGKGHKSKFERGVAAVEDPRGVTKRAFKDKKKSAHKAGKVHGGDEKAQEHSRGHEERKGETGGENNSTVVTENGPQ